MSMIGIMTFHNSINYGAVLQAYALQKKISDIGLDSEFIDYHDPQQFNKHRSLVPRLRHYGYQYVARFLTGTKRQERTNSFRRRYLSISPQKYQDAKLLYADPPLYDAYIVGSDQVWNPLRYGKVDPSWFLTFAPRGKRRIAYAPSLGVSTISSRYEENFREWIRQIDHLSVREVEGKDIIFQLTRCKAEVVLDPSLLLAEKEWEEVSEPFEFSKPYIFCYIMGNDSKVIAAVLNIAKQLAKWTGYKIIRTGQKEFNYLNLKANFVFDAGPSEFLGLLQNASFVVTNSFHGAAFSINFKKSFFVPFNQNLPPEKTLNSRMTTLLKGLGLEHRHLPVGSGLLKSDELEIDYLKVTEKLKKERIKSIAFLQNALAGI